MTRYLLDTNIVSDLMRNPRGRVAEQIARVGEDAVCTSIIVVAELRYGAGKQGSARLVAQLERVLAGLTILPFEDPADHAYAALRVELEAVGKPVGGYGALIAAHALAVGCNVVTANEREFRRVAGLTVVNWLRP